MPQPENEWEYDAPRRVARAVGTLEPRYGDLGTLLHLRWQVDALMQAVKMVHLTAHELVSLIAILAPAAGQPMINEWDHDVRERVSDAVKHHRDGDLATLLHLRTQMHALMHTVRINDLSAPELVAMLAVLAPANGRRLLVDTLEEALRPILRVVDNGADLGNAAAQFAELGADAGDELAGAGLVTS